VSHARLSFVLAALTVAAFCAPPLLAQVPRTLHYQATLVDEGFPVEGAVDVGVAFYAEPTGGAPLAGWSETYTDVALTAGRLQLLLGSQTPLPDALLDAPTLHLELAVDGEALPRLPVASTAFALRAGRAEAVAPGSVVADALADGAVTETALAEGAVTAAALAGASVTPPALADAAVTGEKIAEGAVATSHLADNAVTSGKLGPSAVVGTVLADGAVTSPKLANGAVTAAKVGAGQLVTSLNGLTDGVRLIEGDNVDIEVEPGSGAIIIEVSRGDRSSRRWKTDIVPLKEALPLVQRLRGVRYRWTESGASDLGFIAEEVGAVVPEVVSYAPNGVDAERVDYARLVALLVEAVKAQQAQIEADRAALDALRARLDALERAQSAP
jgi:hypothetical protein